MNPYQTPVETNPIERPRAVFAVLSVFCFGWAFGTATRLQLDAFGWLGIAVLIVGLVLWQLGVE